MGTARGYFDKTVGNGVLRISAQVDYIVSLTLYNSDTQELRGSISTPPSDYTSGSAQGAPSNGLPICVPGTANLSLGPIPMHPGEIFELNFTTIRPGFILHSFVVVLHSEVDDTVAEVAMWE